VKKLLVFILMLCILIGCTPNTDIEVENTASETELSTAELPRFKGFEYLEDGGLAIYTPPSAEIFFVIDANTIWLESDLSEQTLLVHRGEETIDMFSISSGLPATPTPTGSYRVYKMQTEHTMWLDNVAYDTPWMMFFHHDYAIHSANWHDSFGEPMSLGCINMFVDEAREIYYQVEIGTHIYIHE